MSGRSKPIQINQDYRNEGNSDDEYSERMDDMTVGSLPGSRRSRRMMVSSGGNELYGSLGAHHSLYYRNHGRMDDDDLSGTHYMARSLPVPRAPYLHSRRDTEIDKRLSRIPDISLPASATETESSSIPYGSLNESKLHLPQAPSEIPFHSAGKRRNPSVRFNEQMKGEGSIKDSGNSLPAYIPNNAFGHASLSSKSNFGGIGSILGEQNEKSTEKLNSSSPKNNTSIESALARHFDEKIDLKYSRNLDEAPQNIAAKSVHLEEPLSTSLTALDILENSKLPAGVLSPTETDSFRAVARSLSDEGKGFVNAQNQLERQYSSDNFHTGIDSQFMPGEIEQDTFNSIYSGQGANFDLESDSESHMEPFNMEI